MRTLCAFAMLGIVLVSTPLAVHAACGDGVRDGDEDCDGADLGSATCATVTGGFVQSGTLACNPDCTFNTADCRRAFLAGLIPARGGKNRCQLEWGVVGTSSGKGQSTRRECTDGDGQCDQDHDFNNTCAMEIQLCLNVPDPKVEGCPFATQPGKVFRVEVLQPKGDQQVTTAVLDAAKNIAIGAGTTANASATAVSYSPPITNFQCGQSTVHIPLRGTTGHARPGKVRIRARSSDNSGRVKATGTLLLVCNP